MMKMKNKNWIEKKDINMSKSMRTGTIRYNITDRNRKYVGQPRNFNVPKVVALINSGAVQELVTKGDLYGYLGHGVRKEYGLMPNELGVATCADGQIKLTPIDPCLRTISIKAYEDGTIEHEAEFLDNHLGRTAWQWHTNKVGGFSSVFAPSTENPTAFMGFDYVRMPNYDSNRGFGYVADCAMYVQEDNAKLLSLKQRAAYRQAIIEEKAVIMDSIMQNYAHNLASIQKEIQSKEEILKKLNHLQAAYDCAQKNIAELQSTKDSLEYENSRLSIPSEHQPMMRLSVNNNDSAMDSVEQQSKKTKEEPLYLNTNNEFNHVNAVMDSLASLGQQCAQEMEPCDADASTKLIRSLERFNR